MVTWTKTSKNNSTWSKAASHSAVWAKTSKGVGAMSFLLLETGSYLLLEDGSSKLMLENSGSASTTWTKINKS